MMKAQIEIVVVLGVLLVFIIVAFYALQGSISPSPVPVGIYEEQRQVASTVNNMVRGAADNTLKDMMANGGYLSDPPGGIPDVSSVPTVGFLMGQVPYWIRCDNPTYPALGDIEYWMAEDIKTQIREGLEDVEHTG